MPAARAASSSAPTSLTNRICRGSCPSRARGVGCAAATCERDTTSNSSRSCLPPRWRARHERALEVRRKELALDGFEMAERMRALVAKKAEMLMEDDEALMKTPLKDLTLSYGISVDKGLQALGEQKVVVEHRTGKPTLADAMKAIEEARAALQKEAIPVETTVVQGVGSEADVDEERE